MEGSAVYGAFKGAGGIMPYKNFGHAYQVAKELACKKSLEILERGCLHEFRTLEFALDVSLPSYLGILNEIQNGEAYFTLLACDTKERMITFDGFYLEHLSNLKKVSVEDLPLYVGWKWHSDKYVSLLKGSV
jgi:hypothetical protein